MFSPSRIGMMNPLVRRNVSSKAAVIKNTTTSSTFFATSSFLMTKSSNFSSSSSISQYNNNSTCSSSSLIRRSPFNMSSTNFINNNQHRWNQLFLHQQASSKRSLASAAAPAGATTRPDIRNIAVIAHVDHGKTTLVDSLLKLSGTMSNARNRVMDSNAQEKERGITILAKNTSVILDGGKRRINIVDTPGHLDFSGEVERTLQTVEGFLLLVDAAEGVKPGTRYVLKKALALNLKPIVIVNKIDKDSSRIEKVMEDVENLFLDTAVNEDQLDITFLYGSGRDGYINKEVKIGGDLKPLFDTIFEKVPEPSQPAPDCGLQMLVSQVAEEGDIKALTGHIFRGHIKTGDVVNVTLGDQKCNGLVKEIRNFIGTAQDQISDASFGDNVIIKLQEPRDGTKIPLQIGASVCDEKNPNPWPYRPPDDPTFSLFLCELTAPWKEKELTDTVNGRWIEIIKRIRLESLVNTALRVDIKQDKREIMLSGRGPLHISVIIEDMRRQGYAFELKAPQILTKVIDGEVHEPYERLYLDFKEKHSADVIGMLVQRQAEVGDLKNLSDERVAVEASMPVRCMMNLPLDFNRMTVGDGILNHASDGFKKQIVQPEERETGALVAIEAGDVQAYSMNALAKHGVFFVQPGDDVQYGQVVGENTNGARMQDTPVNITKKNEQLGGMRANATDSAKKNKAVANYRAMPLEQMLAWMTPYETIAVTPKSIRMRLSNFNGKTISRGKNGKK